MSSWIEKVIQIHKIVEPLHGLEKSDKHKRLQNLVFDWKVKQTQKIVELRHGWEKSDKH